VGCIAPTPSGAIVNEVAATMVPNLDLDVYLYFDQGSPTSVPEDLNGSSTYAEVDSLAVWGIVDANTYTFGGALTLDNAADASNMFSQLPKQSDIWTQLSDRTIYMVYGSGEPADSLESAISNNNFKNYDDNQALQEISLLPYGSSTKPAGIGIIKTTATAVNLLKQYVDAGTAATINSLYATVKSQFMVAGLYSSQPIDLTDIMQKIQGNNASWDTDLGVVAAVDSAYPGLVFSPIASRYLDGTGYTKTTLNNLPVYKAYLDSGDDSIPVLINVSENHIFATSSGNEAYADTLMTGITR